MFYLLHSAERQHYPASGLSTLTPPVGVSGLDGSFLNNSKQWSTLNKRSHGINDLSAQIRQELDRSIAKHLEKSKTSLSVLQFTSSVRCTMCTCNKCLTAKLVHY